MINLTTQRKILILSLTLSLAFIFILISYPSDVFACHQNYRHRDHTIIGAGTWQQAGDPDLAQNEADVAVAASSIGRQGPQVGTLSEDAYDNITFVNLSSGRYRVRTHGKYGGGWPDQMMVFETSDENMVTLEDLDGSASGSSWLWGEKEIDMNQPGGWIKIRSWSQIPPANCSFTVDEVQVDLISSTEEPDIIATEPTLNSGTLEEGSDLTFKGNVVNQEIVDVIGTFNNKFQVDLGYTGSYVDQEDFIIGAVSSITNLLAGESKQVISSSWNNVPLGTHAIRLCADTSQSESEMAGAECASYFPPNAEISILRENCSGYSNCYTSMSDWESSKQEDLVSAGKSAVLRIEGEWTNPDTDSVFIDGWTTDATHYIEICATGEARHNGKWDTSAYRIKPEFLLQPLRNSEDFVIIDGIQLESVSATHAYLDTWSSSNGVIRISNSIINGRNIGTYGISGGMATYKVWNNIVYDFNTACIYMNSDFSPTFVYSNTMANCGKGYNGIGQTQHHLRNNISYKNNTDYAFSLGALETDLQYNLSYDGTADNFGGTGNRANKTVLFVNEAGKDYHLAFDDSEAQGNGTNLSSDSNISFSNDIDNNIRSGSWDIGADEAHSSSFSEESVVDLPPNADISILRQNCSGYSNCYTTMFAWEAAEQTNLVTANKSAVLRIEGGWTNPDNKKVFIDGWITDPAHYILIYTTPEARHDGKWDTTAYRMEPSNYPDWILRMDAVNHVRIDGLQINMPRANSWVCAINADYIGDTGDNADIRISNSIIRETGPYDPQYAICLNKASNYDQNDVIFRVWNNIIYDFNNSSNSRGIIAGRGTQYIYNNTIYNSGAGIEGGRDSGSTIAKNNLVNSDAINSSFTDFVGTFDNSSDYNASSDNTAPDNGNSRRNQIFTFVDASGKDFHISSSDAGARDRGADLSSDSFLAIYDDIDFILRFFGAGWDIGADEADLPFVQTSFSIDSKVSNNNDDAEEEVSNGSMNLTSSDLDIVVDGSTLQKIGMRFNNISIPQGVMITNAYIEFTADESDSEPTSLIFYGEDTNNASAFTSTQYNISSRTTTSASVNWNNVPQWFTNNKYQSPNLVRIIQEIIDRAGWLNNNSIAIIVSGDGARIADSYEGSTANAPLLHIEYEVDPGVIDETFETNNCSPPYIFSIPPKPECSDLNDNDDDELIDDLDPGCWTDPSDEDTYDPNREAELLIVSPILNAVPNPISQGDSSTLSWTCYDSTIGKGSGFSTGDTTTGSASVSPESTTTYTLQCFNGADGRGQAVEQITVLNIPAVNISANPATVRQGNATTIIWSSTDVDSCSVTGPNGFSYTALSGSESTGAITQESVYTIVCQNAVTQASAQAKVTILPKFEER